MTRTNPREQMELAGYIISVLRNRASRQLTVRAVRGGTVHTIVMANTPCREDDERYLMRLLAEDCLPQADK